MVLNVFIVNQVHRSVHFEGHKIKRNHTYGFIPHKGKFNIYSHSKLVATFKINKYGFIHDLHSKSHLTKSSVILNMKNYIQKHGLVIKLLEHGRGRGYGCFLGNQDRFTLLN